MLIRVLHPLSQKSGTRLGYASGALGDRPSLGFSSFLCASHLSCHILPFLPFIRQAMGLCSSASRSRVDELFDALDYNGTDELTAAEILDWVQHEEYFAEVNAKDKAKVRARR